VHRCTNDPDAARSLPKGVLVRDRIYIVSWLERQDRLVAMGVVAVIGLVVAIALSTILPGFRNLIALALAPVLAVGLYEGRRLRWSREELTALVVVVGVGLALFLISPTYLLSWLR
jgi:hypothetical protein